MRLTRWLALILSMTALSACGLPRSGPYYEDLTGGMGAAKDPGFDLIEVTERIVALANLNEARGFQMSLIEAEVEDTARLGVGDRLTVTIWERGENGLFSGIGGATALSAEVEGTGRIFLPYVGEVRAEGRTARELRGAIRAALADKTLDPQVEVKRDTGDSKSVTVTGAAGVSAVTRIGRTTQRLLGLVASVGASFADPDIVTVTLRRGSVEGRIWLRELFENAQNNVAVRDGDVVFLDTDDRHFRALGAVGQARVRFPTRDISVLDALALIGGLNGAKSDPSGVFLFREEPAEIASRLGVGDGGARKVGYLLDLTQGRGLFLADALMMRDGDLIYVTEAPFTRFQLVAGSIASTIGFAGSVGAAQTAFAP